MFDTVVLSVVVVLMVIALIERSYRIKILKKIISSQEVKLNEYKNRREEFAISLSQSQQGSSNMLNDPLTGLLTKEAFDSQHTHLLNQSKRFNNLYAVLVLDINQFHRINENYARTVGDKLLREVGSRLRNTLRDVDVVSRHEKDVFVALLPNMIKPEVIVHAVQRIMNSISQPIEINGEPIDFSVSIGIAVYPFDGEDRQTLLAHAQDALKKAKASGKNVFQFYQEQTQILGQRELGLKVAVKSPDFWQHLSLDYLPYYNTSLRKIDAIEVIATLNHPELGRISFSELSRVSQYSSMMFQFYEWMMKKAAEKYANSHNEGLRHTSLIFKFDLKQLSTPNFSEKIIEIINRVKTQNKIVIELADDVENTNLEAFRKPISTLNELHVPLAIGVLVLGHFALNKLNQIHFDYLKIDEKLVHDLAKREESKFILERILTLVDTLKIDTLTAGVDTQEQRTVLESMGCSVMQGKLFKELVADE